MRCDDGLAWRAADCLDGRFSTAEVEILRVHQLTPELAEDLTRCDTVIFVDAAAAGSGNGKPGEVRSAEIVVTEDPHRFSHQLSPSCLVALAGQLYGGCPSAFSVTLTGACFDHGEYFSSLVEAALPALVARIEELVRVALAGQSLPAASCEA